MPASFKTFLRSPRRLLGIWLLLVASGCGGGDGLEYTEVGGTIKLGGRPLPGVQVEFYPVVAPGKPALPPSRAVTDEAGRYQLTCVNNRVGAVIGHHRIVVRRPHEDRDPDAAPKAPAGPVIPIAYTIVGDTPLRVDVTPQRRDYELNLSRR